MIDYKKAREFGTLELLAKQVVEGFITGLHKSPFHGFSVEFAEHRLYNTGESTRHIDWKLFARSEKLFIKRYEEETNLRCHILIDGSSSMLFPSNLDYNKLSFSIDAAAALIFLMRRQRDAFGVSVFSDQLDFYSPAKSSLTHQRFLFSKMEPIIILINYRRNKAINIRIATIEIEPHNTNFVKLFHIFLWFSLSILLLPGLKFGIFFIYYINSASSSYKFRV